MSSFRLRVVPELAEHQVHAAALTPEHKGRMLTLAAMDGTTVRGILSWSAPTLTPGRTVLHLKAIGTSVSVGVPDHAPIYVHPDTEVIPLSKR